MTTYLLEDEYDLGPPDLGRFVIRVIRCNCKEPPEVRITYDDDLEIIRADDQVLIADSLVELWERSAGSPQVTYGDRIVTITGTNRTVSYGLVEHDERRRLWRAVKSPEITEKE